MCACVADPNTLFTIFSQTILLGVLEFLNKLSRVAARIWTVRVLLALLLAPALARARICELIRHGVVFNLLVVIHGDAVIVWFC